MKYFLSQCGNLVDVLFELLKTEIKILLPLVQNYIAYQFVLGFSHGIYRNRILSTLKSPKSHNTKLDFFLQMHKIKTDFNPT